VSGSDIIADFMATSPEGVECGVLLFAPSGKLSCLEFYSFGDDSFTIPHPSTFKSLPKTEPVPGYGSQARRPSGCRWRVERKG
jgi:hypothetical protein